MATDKVTRKGSCVGPVEAVNHNLLDIIGNLEESGLHSCVL